ncbi:MAG: ribonuclease E/G [Pseudomonadota bacterium]
MISQSPGELRALSFKMTQAVDFLVRRTLKDAPFKHDVYLAKIEQWSPGLGGIFVNLGDAGKAFLPTSKAQPSLKPGALYPVTVVRSAIGDKLPRVSLDIVFASARMLLIPHKKGVHLSHRAKNRGGQTGQLILHSFRQEGFDGLLIRENAFHAQQSMLNHEARFLTERYKAFLEEVRLTKAPGPLKFSSNYLDWFIADIISQGEIQVGSDKLFQKIRSNWAQICPDLAQNIVPIAEQKADALIDEQLQHILSSHVPFGTVGELVFEHTEALTAIDVNAFAGHKKNPRHHLNVNMQAVQDIAKQVRLRNIGGPIIIDFINMPDESSRQAIEAEMQKAFAQDPAEAMILPISKLGIMEMSREKIGPSVAETLLTPKQERVFSFETVALSLVRSLVRQAYEYADRHIVISSHPDFLEWLKHRPQINAMIPSDIRTRLHLKSDLKADPHNPYLMIAGIAEPYFIY